MKVKFLKDADTMRYGRVEKDEVITVKVKDGDAFINNGVAKKAKGAKENG